MQSSRISPARTAHGVVTGYSVRTAKSGNFAHEFNVGSRRYSYFSDEDLVPFQDGDVISFEFRTQKLRTGSKREYFSVQFETLELVIPSAPGSLISGFVYILSNPAMKGLVKVGYTNGLPEDRAAELSAVTGVPRPFRVEWAHPVTGDPKSVEQRAHAKLWHCRDGKEFFRISVDEAKDAILDAYFLLHPEARVGTETAMAERQADFAERRAHHLEAQGQRKDAEARARFWESSLGDWLTNGSVKLRVSNFMEKPEGRATGFVSSMFGKKTRSWLSIEVIGRNNYTTDPWRVLISGVIDNRNLSHVYDRATLSEAVNDCLVAKKIFPCENVALQIVIGNQYIMTPNCYDCAVPARHESITLDLSQIQMIHLDDQKILTVLIDSFR